jgi:hypothetical protein
MKLNLTVTKEEAVELFQQLDDEAKDAVLNELTCTQVVDKVAQHLKGEADYWSWSISGWRWGSELRQAIADIQGIEQELKSDYQSKLRSAEHERDNYKHYYDWYFKIYHFDKNFGDESLIRYVERLVGKPKD